MKPHFVALVLVTLNSVAHAQQESKKVLFQCDATRSQFRIGFEDVDLTTSGELVGIDPQVLHFPGFGYSGRATRDGNLVRSPDRTQKLYCGKLEIRLKSEYLNENTGGEMGAIEFGSIEVLSGTRRMLGPIGVAVCDFGFSRWRYFGGCPESYVTAILVKLDLGPPSVFVIAKRAYYDVNANEMKNSVVEFRAP